jgi:hypothetical protein
MAHYQGHFCNEDIPGLDRYLHTLDPKVDFERIESAIALNCDEANRYTQCRHRNKFRSPRLAHDLCMLNLRTRTPRCSQPRPSRRRAPSAQLTPTMELLHEYDPRIWTPLYNLPSAHDIRGMDDTPQPQQCSWRTECQCEDDRCQLMDMGGWNNCVPRDCEGRTERTCWGNGADGSSCHWDEVEQECDAMYDALD